MRNYASLADSKYLPQLLALYESLRKHSSEEFTLYVLPMDQQTVDTLMAMVLPNVQLILGFHESHEGMAEARANRSHKEYCWTCASNLCEVLLDWSNWHNESEGTEAIESITYLDADCYFFSDPKVIHDEIGDRSIAVIPHRLIPSKKHLESNGQFNVSWVSFKNNSVGRECCSTWAWQCREQCSESIGCGDQAYLDSWPGKYGPELAIIQNIGAGLAPWNLANYGLYQFDGPPQLAANRTDYSLGGLVPVVFYHFHETRFHPDGSVFLTGYELRPVDEELIYKPYIAAVNEAQAKLRALQAQTV